LRKEQSPFWKREDKFQFIVLLSAVISNNANRISEKLLCMISRRKSFYAENMAVSTVTTPKHTARVMHTVSPTE
jgi:hypothetical protein